MGDATLWAVFGALIGAIVAGIAILLQLGAASKERSEAIYQRLLSELNDIVKEIGGCKKPENLSEEKKRIVSRMLHMHLDGLVETIAIEGRSWWRKFLYKLGIGRRRYIQLGQEWYLDRHRYERFESWYKGILGIYNSTLDASTYVREIFHCDKDIKNADPHENIRDNNCLKTYFNWRLDFEKGRLLQTARK